MSIRLLPYAAALLLACTVGALHSPAQTRQAEAQFHRAQAFEEAGDLQRAEALYRELLAAEPTNVVYFDAVQRVMLRSKRYDELSMLIREQLRLRPNDIPLRVTLGNVCTKAGRDEEARAIWEQILSITPCNPLHYRLVASAMVENRLLESAAEVYRRARTSCNNPDLFVVELAQLLSASMDYRAAAEEYVRWLRRNPAQISLVQSRMGSFTWKEDARKAAIDAVRAELEKSDDPRLRELLGWLFLEGKEFEAAYDVYREVDRQTAAQGKALLLFAERAFRERAYAVSARAYLDAINVPLPEAQRPGARYGYANALKEMDAQADTLEGPLLPGIARPSRSRYAGALLEFRRVIEEYPSSDYAAQASYQIGRIQFERYFDLDAALRAFEEAARSLRAKNPLRYDISLRIGDVYLARGDTVNAAGRYLAVAAAPDALPDQGDEASFRLAEIEYFGGRFQEAMRRLSAISLNLKADFANDALSLASFLEENAQTSPEALRTVAAADFAVRRSNNGEALVGLRDALVRFPTAPLADDVLLKIGYLEEASGRHREALAAFERLLEEFRAPSAPRDRAQFAVGEIYERGLHDAPGAIAAYQRLLEDFPHSVLASDARRRIRLLRGDAL